MKAVNILQVGADYSLDGDATGQSALDGAAVELFEELRTHAKSFQSTEGE